MCILCDTFDVATAVDYIQEQYTISNQNLNFRRSFKYTTFNSDTNIALFIDNFILKQGIEQWTKS